MLFDRFLFINSLEYISKYSTSVAEMKNNNKIRKKIRVRLVIHMHYRITKFKVYRVRLLILALKFIYEGEVLKYCSKRL